MKTKQDYIDEFYKENGNRQPKEKLKLKYSKYNKIWQVVETFGILEKVLYGNKDKNTCRLFIKNKK